MQIERFTYSAYLDFIRLIRASGYRIASYHDCEALSRPCVLRHDIDNSLPKAARMAELEAEHGVRATYFALVASDFYNVLSRGTRKVLLRVASLGHEIGLHFDETRYPPTDDMALISSRARDEAKLLSNALDGYPVRVVSMHRPSRAVLEADLRVEGLINSYGTRFFREYKYLSDSRMHWREDAEAIVASGRCERLHVLTHPFWYDDTERSAREKLLAFFAEGRSARYDAMRVNFRDLDEFVRREDVL